MNVEEITDKLLALKKKADHDPLVQDYLSKAALPAELEYVRPEKSGRRAGYFRRRPGRDSPKQVQHKLKFSRVAYHQFGTKGTAVCNDGRVISRAAEMIGNELRGIGSDNDPKVKEREKLIQMLEAKETTAKRIHASWI